MHRYPQNQSYVGSSGQTLTTNVSMTLCNCKFVTKPMSYVTTFVPNQISSQINTVPTPAAAWTMAWLLQEVGGGVHCGHVWWVWREGTIDLCTSVLYTQQCSFLGGSSVGSPHRGITDSVPPVQIPSTQVRAPYL